MRRCFMFLPGQQVRSILFSIPVLFFVITTAFGQDGTNDQSIDDTFQNQIQPLIQKYCFDCHNVDDMKSGIRVDQLSSRPDDRQMFLWKDIQTQIAHGAMPPKEERQLSAAERQLFGDWIPRAMSAAAARNAKFNGSTRRLTVSQYRNTLRDLLGLSEDVTKTLPPDGVSKDGFNNNVHSMGLSPLQVEAYFDIAEKALNLCLVDAQNPPVIQNFRVELGAAINPQPCPDKLILGASSELLNNDEFIVTELSPMKPFVFQPFHMQTKFNFIEGYAGNDTVRGWRSYDSIYHAVFACMRGTPGYPLGESHQVVPNGLLLRPAIPSSEIFGQSNTYGPMANFKISLRELPDQGDFRVSVKAARYDDALLLDANSPAQSIVEGKSISIDCREDSLKAELQLPVVDGKSNSAEPLATNRGTIVRIPEEGVYQVDVYWAKGDAPGLLSLNVAGQQTAGKLFASPGPNELAAKESDEQPSAFAVLRLSAGEHPLSAKCGNNSRLRRLVFHRLDDQSELAKRFVAFEKRTPWVGVYLGLRRDCGSTLARVGEPQPVTATSLQEFVFEGPINDFPSPDVEKDNVNYLAGVREIGVRSEYLDGRDTPRLMIRSIEFEGPLYDIWPPATHRRILIESANRDNPAAYAREIITAFATRAFRRPAMAEELAPIFAVWEEAFAKQHDFQQSVKDALLVVLTSPQFLMLIEESHGPEPENLNPFELASKLSYFLWNTAPDQRLLELAATNKLHESLEAELDRMIQDQRFGQFVQEFGSQWLSLDKFDVVSIDMKRFPRLTRDVKSELRHEPIQYLQYLLQQNRPVRELVTSDFLLANEIVANYYGLTDRSRSGFRFQPVRHENEHLGGVLTQAGILAGLSDGREANPVKRGAWLARKIVAEPPADPPPNAPKLPEDDGSQLTLRQKLQRHREQEGCVKCHSGIDPWGLPFEQYDAGGLFKRDVNVDSQSKLPDGTEIRDVNSLKRYLANDRIDQITFGFLKHVAIYAAGRSLSYNEFEDLKRKSVQLGSRDPRMQDLLKEIVRSDLFLKK